METEDRILFLDGAMGTQLQANGLPAGASPEIFMMEHGNIIEEIHAAYIDSGSDIIYTNTFGANAKKLTKTRYTVEEIVTTAVQLAKSAAKRKPGVRVALDIGPIGELLEPNGYLPFDDAYDLFAEQVIVGEKAGADLIVFETMSDLYEVKAAILAAKEHTRLPVFVTIIAPLQAVQQQASHCVQRGWGQMPSALTVLWDRIRFCRLPKSWQRCQICRLSSRRMQDCRIQSPIPTALMRLDTLKCSQPLQSFLSPT